MSTGRGEAALTVDRELTVVTALLPLVEALGRSAPELIGRRLPGLLHADDGRLAPALLRGQPTVPACTRWRWRTAAGDARTLEVWWLATADGWTGTLGGRHPLAADDAAALATGSAERLARLGSFEHDLAAGRTTWSQVMYELHDLDPGQPPPTSLDDYLALVHPDDAEAWQRALAHALTTGEVVTLTARVRRRDGSHRWLEVTQRCELRTDGSPARVVGTMQDVTDHVTARAQLARDREQALADTRAKSDFLARFTHELRTPIAGVIGMIELALDDRDSVSRTDHLTAARSSARHLLELIDDLLDAGRADGWRFNVVAIDFALDEVMADALAMVAPRAQGKGLALAGEVAPELVLVRRGDPLRLRQILVNLLHNAVKFTERGGVTVRMAPRDGGEVELVVEDTGVGMGPELQGSVFEPYVSNDAGEGLGLGLAITRELVTALGGTISFTSTPGVGTRFTVVVPLAEPTGARTGRSSPGLPLLDVRPRSGRALRVLVVEDHPLNATFLAASLERAGHQVESVGTAQAAVDAAARGACDVALMDFELPDLDGPAAVRAIRAAEQRAGRARLPILGLSAHRDRALVGAAAGMDGYLVKPPDAGELLGELDRVTGEGWRPPVDHALRLARVGGRKELAATIVHTYLAHAGGLLDPVTSALDAGSEEGVRRAAHGLRAALLMVGALPAAELAARLERGSLAQAREQRPSLAFELARASAELELSV
jgi:hypothetical protein